MGLRLYQPPVESDLPAKPAVERDAARARTSIRRNFRRTADEVRERRRRIQAAAAAHRVFNDPRRSASGSTFEPPALSPRTNDHGGATSASDQGRRALRDVASRMGTLDDRVAALFGDRWAHLHADSHSSSLRDDDSDSSPMLTMAVDPEFLPRSRPPLEPYTLSNIRSTQAANHAPRSTMRFYGTFDRIRRPAGVLLDDPLGSESRQYQRRPSASNRRRNEPLPMSESNRLDGLGDHNRSLSPEGDNVWDTLLTTLAPDPQPPSVGSSFASASASASAAASQGTATGSSRTSFTTPDAADESAFDPHCESGCDNSDTEGDDDDDEDDFGHIRLPSISALGLTRRSFGDVARNNNDDPLELFGGIGGMQRIVRNLARREDIPDEWWAEVGLSRTLSREASAT